jgi:hypothetical protein
MGGDGVGRGGVEVCLGEVIARESKLPEQLPQQFQKAKRCHLRIRRPRIPHLQQPASAVGVGV